MRHCVILALALGLTSASGVYEIHYGWRGPPAPLSEDGKVVETPEVARARAAHLATHAAVVARVSEPSEKPEDDEKMEKNEETTLPSTEKTSLPAYQGPLAPIGQDGRVIDTSEVAEAKAAHLAAHAQALAAVAESDKSPDAAVWENSDEHRVYVAPAHFAYTTYHLPVVYRGPPAPLAPDGRVLDTPEVLQAREAHLRAYAHAAAVTRHDNCLH